MADVFPNYTALGQAHQEGKDYQIVTKQGAVRTPAVIVALMVRKSNLILPANTSLR